MEMPIRVSRDFAALYPDASASATECAMNLARTGDLVLGRVAQALQPLDVSPAGGLVLGIDWLAANQAGTAAGLWTRLRPIAITAGVVVLVVLGLLSYARGGDARPFIYGQF